MGGSPVWHRPTPQREEPVWAPMWPVAAGSKSASRSFVLGYASGRSTLTPTRRLLGGIQAG